MKKVKLKLELQYNSPVILTFFLLSLLVLFLDQWTDGWTTMHPVSYTHLTLPTILLV